MRMQVILDSPFARPGSAPIGGGKKGEFRDWTKPPLATVQEFDKTHAWLPRQHSVPVLHLQGR